MDRRRALGAGALAWLALRRPADAQGELPVGRVAAATGTVTARRARDEMPLDRSAPVFRDDTLRTGPDGRAQIAFFGGVVLTLGPATEVVVARLLASPKGGLDAVFRLMSGIVRLVGGAPSGPTSIAVETTDVLAAVRSTDWLVDLGLDRSSVFVALGSVEVTGLVGGRALLHPGQGIDAVRGSALSSVALWSAQRVARSMARVTL